MSLSGLPKKDIAHIFCGSLRLAAHLPRQLLGLLFRADGRGDFRLDIHANQMQRRGVRFQADAELPALPHDHGDKHLLRLMKELVAAKTEYDQIAGALKSVRETSCTPSNSLHDANTGVSRFVSRIRCVSCPAFFSPVSTSLTR